MSRLTSHFHHTAQNPNGIGGNLSIYITGIAFWGMTLAGLLIAAMAMRSWDQELDNHFEANNAQVVLALMESLAGKPHNPGQAQPPFLEDIRSRYSLAGLEINGPGIDWRAGKPNNTPPITRNITSQGANGLPETFHITLYDPDKDALVTNQHKHVLLFTGLMSIIFGFILQYILQRILTHPIRNMVETAITIANGDKQARFTAEGSDELGFLARFINQALDATQRSQDTLIQEMDRIAVTLRSISDAVIATDLKGLVQFMNPVAEKLTGYKSDEVQGQPFNKFMRFMDELSRETIPDPVSVCLTRGETLQLNAGNELLIAKNQLEIAVSGTAAPMRNGQGAVIGCVMALQDVRQSREMTHKLSHQASRDSLTGLYNRQSFEDHIKATLEEYRSRRDTHALLYLDLDQFKIVNDTGGHVAGDELLKQLSSLLHTCFRHDDILARLGGDEFGILLKECSDDQALKIAEKLLACFEKFRFTWGTNVFQVGCSIGLVPFRAGEIDLATLLSTSDLACYAAKEAGRNRVHIYEPSDDSLALRQGEMRWATYLNQSLEENLFELFLQPIVALNDDDNTRHWEVLLRLRSEDGKEHTGPGSFMPSAERFGLMLRIDRWVITHAFHKFAEARKFLDMSRDIFAINLSGASLGDPELIDFIRNIQQETAIPWANICFEITETAAIRNLSIAQKFIEELRVLGCYFSLDDFGSGLSSFAYLKNLPVDFLKIDGVFIRDLDKDPMDRAMVDAIHQVGRIMGIKTIAEWVENAETADTLKKIGVDYAQGFLFGKPTPLEQCLAKFSSHFPEGKSLKAP